MEEVLGEFGEKNFPPNLKKDQTKAYILRKIESQIFRWNKGYFESGRWLESVIEWILTKSSVVFSYNPNPKL